MDPYILFCDNHLLVAFKPAGWTTQPHPGKQKNLLDWAKRWVAGEFQKKGNVFLEPIHRLDRPVAGMVVFARTSKALPRLHAQMREQRMEKTYLAVVEGRVEPTEAVLEHYLVHGNHRAVVSDKEGVYACLQYQVEETDAKTSYLRVRLKTGRYHQIRAQLSAIGHPILGDEKYGAHMGWKGEGIALVHAHILLFHPVGGKELIFSMEHGVGDWLKSWQRSKSQGVKPQEQTC